MLISCSLCENSLWAHNDFLHLWQIQPRVRRAAFKTQGWEASQERRPLTSQYLIPTFLRGPRSISFTLLVFHFLLLEITQVLISRFAYGIQDPLHLCVVQESDSQAEISKNSPGDTRTERPAVIVHAIEKPTWLTFPLHGKVYWDVERERGEINLRIPPMTQTYVSFYYIYLLVGMCVSLRKCKGQRATQSSPLPPVSGCWGIELR